MEALHKEKDLLEKQLSEEIANHNSAIIRKLQQEIAQIDTRISELLFQSLFSGAVSIEPPPETKTSPEEKKETSDTVIPDSKSLAPVTSQPDLANSNHESMVVTEVPSTPAKAKRVAKRKKKKPRDSNVSQTSTPPAAPAETLNETQVQTVPSNEHQSDHLEHLAGDIDGTQPKEMERVNETETADGGVAEICEAEQRPAESEIVQTGDLGHELTFAEGGTKASQSQEILSQDRGRPSQDSSQSQEAPPTGSSQHHDEAAKREEGSQLGEQREDEGQGEADVQTMNEESRDAIPEEQETSSQPIQGSNVEVQQREEQQLRLTGEVTPTPSPPAAQMVPEFTEAQDEREVHQEEGTRLSVASQHPPERESASRSSEWHARFEEGKYATADEVRRLEENLGQRLAQMSTAVESLVQEAAKQASKRKERDSKSQTNALQEQMKRLEEAQRAYNEKLERLENDLASALSTSKKAAALEKRIAPLEALNDRMTSLEQTTQEMTGANESIRADVAAMKQKESEAKDTVIQKLAKLTTSLKELRTEREELRPAVDSAPNKEALQQMLNESLPKRLSETVESMKLMRRGEALGEVSTQIETLRTETAEWKDSIQQKIKALKSKEQPAATSAVAAEEVEQLKKSLEDKEQELADLKISVESLGERCEGIEGKIDNREKALDTLSSEHEDTTRKLTKQVKSTESISERISTLETSVESMRTQKGKDKNKETLEAIEERLRKLEEENATLQASVTRAKEGLQAAEKKVTKYAATVEALQEANDTLSRQLQSLSERQVAPQTAASSEPRPSTIPSESTTDTREEEASKDKGAEAAVESGKSKRKSGVNASAETESEVRTVEAGEGPASTPSKRIAKKRKEKPTSNETAKESDKVEKPSPKKSRQAEMPEQEDVEAPKNTKEKADARASPLKLGTRRATKKVIYFSGFNDDTSFTTAMKAELTEKVKTLGGTVRVDSEYDNQITHVVTPPNCRTMKTLAAVLTSRWLVSPHWVVDSANAGKFLDENGYGKKFTERPFEGKRVYISDSFKKENKKKSYKAKNAETLVATLGRGTIVKKPSGNVDYTLVGSRSDKKEVYGEPLTWTQFINLIPGPRPEKDADTPPDPKQEKKGKNAGAKKSKGRKVDGSAVGGDEEEEEEKKEDKEKEENEAEAEDKSVEGEAAKEKARESEEEKEEETKDKEPEPKPSPAKTARKKATPVTGRKRRRGSTRG